MIYDCDAKNLRKICIVSLLKTDISIMVRNNVCFSSLLFQTHFNFDCIYLLSFQGHNLLQKLYEDPKRWAFLFQTYIQLTMLQEHNKPCSAPVKIMERSLLRRDSFLKLFQGVKSFLAKITLVLFSKKASCF